MGVKRVALNQVINYISANPKKETLERLISIISIFAKGKTKQKLEEAKKGPYLDAVIEKLNRLSPAIRKKLIQNLIIGFLVEGRFKRVAYEKKYGVFPPSFLVMSPSMCCNLRCIGCYAGEYSRKNDLPYPVVKRVINEAREMGISFITISGGEPFLWPHFFEMAEDFPDIFFQVYTNGTLITDEVAERIAKLGNIAPAISVEGFGKQTDKRRGEGIYDKVLNAMRLLKKHKCLFGFSATPVSSNAYILASDKFVDFYEKQGCMFGWFFNYIPIGRKPDVNLMPTPEQRTRLRKKVHAWREAFFENPRKGLFLGDFWNDGPFVKGCIAAATQDHFLGAGYLHINVHGDVESCAFVHFAVDNVKNKSLRDAIKSKFFEEIRKGQKEIKNWLAPCCIIDNPKVLRNAVRKGKARPTHPGAETIITDANITKFLDNYAKRMQEVSKKDWNEKYCARCGGKPV